MLRLQGRVAWAAVGLSAMVLSACSTSRDERVVPVSDLPEYMQFGYDSKGQLVTTYKVGTPYEVAGVWYYPAEDYGYREEGLASWYGPGFHGKRTANGEVYDMNALTAAHKTLPMPSVVHVTNLENGRSMRVRINDRGPFVEGRIIDLSRRSAQLLGVVANGTARVRVELIPDESLTLKNIAMDQSGQLLVRSPDIQAAPRSPVSSEPLAPPSQQDGSGLSVKAPKLTAKAPSVSAPSSSSASSAPSVSTSAQAPSVARSPAAQPMTTQAPAPRPQPVTAPRQVASAPATRSAPIAKTTLAPPPNTAPPPVTSAPVSSAPVSTASSPATSAGSGSGFPSVNVNTPDVTPLAKSALQGQASTGSAAGSMAKDMLPSPKQVAKRAYNAMTDDGPQQTAMVDPASVDPAAMGEPGITVLEPPAGIPLPDGVFIQAGSFSDVNNARRLEAQLSSLGNVFVAMVDVDGQVFHRVRVGPISDPSIADQLLAYMQDEGYGEARIVSE